MAAISRLVAIGRLMKSSEMFTRRFRSLLVLALALALTLTLALTLSLPLALAATSAAATGTVAATLHVAVWIARLDARSLFEPELTLCDDRLAPSQPFADD